MTSPNLQKSFQIQRQIMENSRSINDYYKDFEEWVQDMNKKDKIVSQIKTTLPTEKPIIINNEENEPKPTPEQNVEKIAKMKKFKRDGNSIKDYYDNWDKVNADAELIDVDSGVVMNTRDTAQTLYDDKKKSNPNPNLAVNITNIRGQLNNSSLSQIDKLKREANGNFALKNFTKSIELYTSAIKLLPVNDKTVNAVNLYNNRGNCQIKLRNYKMGIKDFDNVLDIDPKNIKGLYRRGICQAGIENYLGAFEDFCKAFGYSNDEKEKEMIKGEIDKAVSSINSIIIKERKKMENFNYKDEEEFHKIKIIDVPSDNYINDTDELNVETTKSNSDTNGKSVDKEKEKTTESKPQQKQRGIPTQQAKNILKPEEISKFVYDITTENLSSSSFKYAFRNFGNDTEAKKNYLLKINPVYFQKIFKTDLDKDTLLDIIKCLKLFENHSQIIDYLKGITKVNRIKLVIQLMPKKTKEELMELFDMLEKGSHSSDVIAIKDFFVN